MHAVQILQVWREDQFVARSRELAFEHCLQILDAVSDSAEKVGEGKRGLGLTPDLDARVPSLGHAFTVVPNNECFCVDLFRARFHRYPF